MPSALAKRVLSGDIRSLARACTAVENRAPAAVALMKELFPHTGRAVVVGITGPPGAGKSTLVDEMARALRARAKRVAIVAVDPSSPFTGGAILGDRIRMIAHHADSGVFIRSMATRGCLGGLAAATTDIALLLDAAGFDYVLVETVGVGQDEVEIARLAAVTLVVLVPGMGDGVQAIKAGIMEIADVFVVNKSDQPGADRLEREIRANLSLAMRADAWMPPVIQTVATEGKGIAEALSAAEQFLKQSPAQDRAVRLWTLRLREMLRDRLSGRIPESQLAAAAEDVAARRQDPYSIVDSWADSLSHGRA